jgi:hypothetical protein
MYHAKNNEQLLKEGLDMIDEVREISRIKELSRKQQVAQRYNTKFMKRSFQQWDLVMQRVSIGNCNAKEGKFRENWEGPYRIKSVTLKGAYHLETLNGRQIPRTFIIADLKRYYS